MFKPNPVEFDLPYHQALQLPMQGGWIAERKVDGVRAMLEFGALKTHYNNLTLPRPLPNDWRLHAFDGCLTQKVYYLFDVLTLDGEDTRSRPLFERRTLLRSLKLPDWCQLVPCGKNIGEFLEAVIHDGGGGIVLKNLLERYGRAQWIKVEQPDVQKVVVMAVDEPSGSVQVGQLHDDALVPVGTVFLGSLLDKAQPGQMLEVDQRQCTPGYALDPMRLIRFRPERIDLDDLSSNSEMSEW